MSEFLTVADVARELRVTPRFIRAEIARGRLAAIRGGERVLLVRPAALAAYCALPLAPRGRVQRPRAPRPEPII